MVVGICRITLLVAASHSLKERRMVLRRIKDRVRNKFNVAVAEVSEGEYRDSWQSAQLGFAVISNDRVFSQSMIQKVLDFVDQLGIAKLVDDEQDYVNYGSERAGEDMTHWEPDDFERKPEPDKGSDNDNKGNDGSGGGD